MLTKTVSTNQLNGQQTLHKIKSDDEVMFSVCADILLRHRVYLFP